MTLVAFVSGRSPGLTTTVHALSLTWPRLRKAIIAELGSVPSRSRSTQQMSGTGEPFLWSPDRFRPAP